MTTSASVSAAESPSQGACKPRRDIPQAVRDLRTLSPSRIREWIREHRTKKDRANGKRIQHNPIPRAITMWFKRHPQVREDLAEEISEEEHSREAITETFFENGTFREIEGFRQWIMDLTTKGAKERTIHS